MVDAVKYADDKGQEDRPILETKIDLARKSLKEEAKQALRVLEQRFNETKKSLPPKTDKRDALILPRISLSSRLSSTEQIASATSKAIKDELNERKLRATVKSGQDIKRFFGDKFKTVSPRFNPPETREGDSPIKVIDALRDAIKAMVLALEEDEPDFVARTRQDAYLEALRQSPVGEKYLTAAVQELIRFVSEEAANALLPVKEPAPKIEDRESILRNLSPHEKLILEIIEREMTLQNSLALQAELKLSSFRVKRLLSGLARIGLIIARGESSNRIYIHPLAEEEKK